MPPGSPAGLHNGHAMSVRGSVDYDRARRHCVVGGGLPCGKLRLTRGVEGGLCTAAVSTNLLGNEVPPTPRNDADDTSSRSPNRVGSR